MIKEKIILASQSESRARLLKNAGFDNIQQIPSGFDEAKVKKNFKGSPQELALKLAAEKALKVSKDNPNDWVIAADQILLFQNKTYDKASSVEEARQLFLAMRGKEHALIGGHIIAKNNQILWQHLSCVQLTLRQFSDEGLENYIQQMGDRLLQAVGGYQLEGAAIQFFEKIEGDYFAILGLDLLPLLKALREQGAIKK